MVPIVGFYFNLFLTRRFREFFRRGHRLGRDRADRTVCTVYHLRDFFSSNWHVIRIVVCFVLENYIFYKINVVGETPRDCSTFLMSSTSV